jgi:hypothetical protein
MPVSTTPGGGEERRSDEITPATAAPSNGTRMAGGAQPVVDGADGQIQEGGDLTLGVLVDVEENRGLALARR